MTNMKFENTTCGAGEYIAPLCTIVDITSEGVLCNSFEKPNECDGVYEW